MIAVICGKEVVIWRLLIVRGLSEARGSFKLELANSGGEFRLGS